MSDLLTQLNAAPQKMKTKFLLSVLFVGLSTSPLAGQDAGALAQACDRGDMLSCDNLGLVYQAGTDVVPDLARAGDLFQRACDGGMALACSHLGAMYQNGVGVGRDPATAAFLFERACDGGDLLGCVNLGVSYENGHGVAQDPALAVSLYEQACNGDEMLGCLNLGSMYRTGTGGVMQDPVVAATLYWQACQGGLLLSCINLAVSYENGEGVPQDLSVAVGLYQTACDLGLVMGCIRLGITYEPAPGVASSPVALAEGITKSGWVADDETRDPLGDAIVDIRDLGLRVITGATGRVEFANLPRGRHRLRVERVGYQVMEGDLDVPGDQEFLLLLNKTTLGDQGAPGQIVGRVLEGGREFGVAGVEVTVMTSAQPSTLSGPLGRFSFVGVEPGLVEVQFARLGYAPRSATVIVQPDGTVEIAASMSARPIELAPIEVVVRSRTLELNGFYQRALTSWGTQLTRADLEDFDPEYISELFRRVPGVRVEDGAILGRRIGFGDQCQLRIFLDGLPMEGWNFDAMPPQDLEAVEVYQGLGIPIQYGPACGVVLLWTRVGG